MSEHLDDFRPFTEYRTEPCACGERIYAGGFPPELLQRVGAHNVTNAHRAFRARLTASLRDGPRPDDDARDVSEAGPGASAGAEGAA